MNIESGHLFRESEEFDPNYQEKRQKRLQLLDKLPPPVYGDTEMDHTVKVSIDLSKRDASKEVYFISKTLKNFKEKKENLLTDDTLQAMLKKFEVEEYATNLDLAVYNPKKIMEDVAIIEEQKKKAQQYQAIKNSQNQAQSQLYKGYQASTLSRQFN